MTIDSSMSSSDGIPAAARIAIAAGCGMLVFEVGDDVCANRVAPKDVKRTMSDKFRNDTVIFLLE
jgi:hypothetical protein